MINSTWATGDWNGDGDFTTGDLVAAFKDGGYEKGPRANVIEAPESASFLMLMVGLIGTAICRRRVAPCSATIVKHEPEM